MTRRISKLLQLRREILKKKIDPLDKKRARDYHVNLAGLRKVMDMSPILEKVERKIETCKSTKKKKNLHLDLSEDKIPNKQLPFTIPSRKNADTTAKNSILAFNDSMNTPFDPSTGSPHESRQLDRGLSPISSWSKPFFRCTMLPGSQVQKFVKKEVSNLMDESKNGFNHSRHADFIIRGNMGGTPTAQRVSSPQVILKRPVTVQTSPTNKMDQKRGYLIEVLPPQGKKEDRKGTPSPDYRVTHHVKEQVDQLESLSTKIDDLSNSITNNIQLYFTSSTSNQLDRVIEQHARAVKSLNTMSDRWAASLMDLMAKQSEGEVSKQQFSSFNPTPEPKNLKSYILEEGRGS